MLKDKIDKLFETEYIEDKDIKAKITDVKSNRWGQKHIFLNGKKYLLDKFKGKFNAKIVTPGGQKVPRAIVKGERQENRINNA